MSIEPQLQPNTLVALLHHRSLYQPDRVAYTFLVDGEAKAVNLTYADLHWRAKAIAAHLQSIGLTGERALLLYPPGLDYIVAFFGCLYAGIIAVPAYLPRPNRSLLPLEAIAANAQITMVLTTVATSSRLKRQSLDSSALIHCQWVTTDTIAADIESWQPPNIDCETLAFLQYTSGSTAMPKGVMVTHQNLRHNLEVIHQGFAASARSQGVIWLPPYHDMGLIGGILQPLYGGFPVTLMSPLMFLQSPFRWLQAISRHRATISGGPSFAYDFCVRKITPEQRAELDLSSWEVAFNGAEPICPTVLERFTTMFEPCGFRREAFYPCYGLAESTLMAAGGHHKAKAAIRAFPSDVLAYPQLSEDNKDAAQDARCQTLVGCGYSPSKQQQLVIVNPTTRQRCMPGTVGEIWLAGPSIAQGYWRQPEDTRQTFKAYLAESGEGPFLRTGDLGLVDQGELFVTGRLKDVMIINGRNHYPQDIERTVEAHTAAIRPHSSLAFSIDVAGAEKVVVVAELERRYWQRWKTPTGVSDSIQNHPPADLQQLLQEIQSAVTKAHALHPETVLLLKPGSLPKTSSGKLQRYLCRDRFLAGELEAVG